MPDCALLPAHRPTRDSVHRRVDELLTHHERRLTTIERDVAVGADTPWEVAHQLTWPRRERCLAELEPFNKMLAVGETMAHLDLLGDQGRLKIAERDGVRHYCPPKLRQLARAPVGHLGEQEAGPGPTRGTGRWTLLQRRRSA